MDEVPPPTDHVLRPHHILLLSILMVAFKDLEVKRFPPAFTLHLHQVLLDEISEVAQPRSHREIIDAICLGPQANAPECYEFVTAIKSIHHDIGTADKMGNFLGNIPCLFLTKSAEEQPKFNRRSFFGYFCRRCYVTGVKLSFQGLVRLCQCYQLWCAGDTSAGYTNIEKDQLTCDLLVYKTQADKKTWAKPDSIEAFDKAQILGDENVAEDSLRAFFEQHFHENNDSGMRQHSLLNLVRMHYVQGEYEAVRNLLFEAISVARTNNDKITLHHCTSLLHRLPPTKPGQKPVLHEIQPDLHPLELLFDVSKLLDERNEQPLNAAFIKIFQAAGLYDHWLDVQLALPVEDQQWAQHAVQSIIWREGGCDKLSAIEENIVLAFTEPGGESTNRLAIILNRAYKTARQGRYNEALAILLETSVWSGLSIHDYGLWAQHIWHILALRATRRGQFRLHREFLLTQRPAGSYNPKDYLFNVGWDTGHLTRDSLYHILQLRQHDQATAGVECLLRALWRSEFLCRYSFYRTGIILLADISLEFGLFKRSRQILDEVMPQIIDGDDLEQKAVACFTLARCMIAAGGSTHAALEEALPYLLMAESDFTKLEMYTSLKDVQYTLSVVYHNLGRDAEAQVASEKHSETVSQQQRVESLAIDTEIQDILGIVGRVGVALASR